MKKILIIGANGFVGRRLLNDLSENENYSLSALSLHPDIFPHETYSFYRMDVKDHAAVENLINRLRPDVVVNASALSVPDYCETHREEAYAMNVAAVENIARCCARKQSRLIHLSTDFVFNGRENRLYTEEDRPDPVNYYGMTKWQGEKAIARSGCNYAIARVVVVYGRAFPGQHGNIFQLVKNRLSARETIRVVADQYRTPTWVADIVDGVERLMSTDKSGVYHICGSTCLSIAEMAYRVADYFHLDRSLIQPVTTEAMGEATPRPRFSGLSIEKARRELGYAPHLPEAGFAELL